MSLDSRVRRWPSKYRQFAGAIVVEGQHDDKPLAAAGDVGDFVDRTGGRLIAGPDHPLYGIAVPEVRAGLAIRSVGDEEHATIFIHRGVAETGVLRT